MTQKLSRLLSYVLRHRPDKFGLELSEGGWVSVNALIAGLKAEGHSVSRAAIRQVVETNDKKRFSLSSDGSLIRASQGHSVAIDLGLTPTKPPEKLFHGTVEKALSGISEAGLIPGRRHHVHLSPDVATATTVGARRGQPIVLEIAAATMSESGFVFYLSDNGVWLTDHVPLEFIRFPAPAEK